MAQFVSLFESTALGYKASGDTFCFIKMYTTWKWQREKLQCKGSVLIKGYTVRRSLALKKNKNKTTGHFNKVLNKKNFMLDNENIKFLFYIL